METVHVQINILWNLIQWRKLKNCLQRNVSSILMENELILRAKKSLNTMLKLS